LHRRKVGRQNVAPEGGVSLSEAVTTYLFPCFNFSADSETAILSLNSVQVLRASATTSEHVSICSNTRFACSR
jgi:hypothetical protein